ncbi:unnamed protein product [Pedinophyceae sp. YPF-701]|nr:unnamed protein product [Pedinophyceae sp. YPF-701]
MEAGILAALSRVHKQVYLICTAAGRILWATGCTEDVLKYPLRELAGRSWHSLLHPDDIPRLVQLFGKALGSRLVGDEGAGDPSRSVVRLRQLPVQVVKKDGTSMSVELCMALVHEVWEHGAERHGPPLLLIHLHSRPPYAADLQKGRTAQRLSSIAWPLPRVACFQLTPDGRFAEPSPALGALLGKTPEELDGATVDAAAHASSREGLRALVAAAMDAAPEGAAAGEGGGNSANGAQSAANADAWAWLRTTDGRRVHRVKVARLAGSEASDPTLHGCVLPATAETRGDMLGLASAALATALGGLQVSVVPLDAAWAVAPALAVGAVWPAGIAPGTHISALVHPEDWASLGPVALASCNTPPQVGHTAVDADAEPDGGALLPLATAPAAAGLYGAAAGDADAAPTPPATLRCTVTWRFRSSPSSDWRWVTCAIHHLAVAEGANQAALVLIIAPHAAAQPSSSIAVAPAQQAANGADASRLGTRSNQAWEAIIVQIRSLLSDLAGSETERLDDVSGGASVWQQRQRASAGGAPPNTQTQIPAAQAATPELASTEIGGLLERLVAMGAKTTDEALALMGGATPPGSDGGTNSVQLL